MLKNIGHTFRFRDGDERFIVWFKYGADGRPTQVVVGIGNALFRTDNAAGAYKPCVTHCKDLIRLARGQPAENNFAARRNRAAKPKLGVVKD